MAELRSVGSARDVAVVYCSGGGLASVWKWEVGAGGAEEGEAGSRRQIATVRRVLEFGPLWTLAHDPITNSETHMAQ